MYSPSAALLLAASLALAAPAPAPAYPTPSPAPSDACTPSSTRLSEFLIENFDFHSSYLFTTPAHQNSWGYVNFTLVNPALGPGHKLTCSSASSRLSDFYYGEMNYDCALAPGQEEERGQGGQGGEEEELSSIQGTFNFARPTNDLAINQTWVCDDQGSRFWAEGRARLDLDCQETNWQNSNWTMGQIYSDRRVTCNKLTQPVALTTMRSIMRRK